GNDDLHDALGTKREVARRTTAESCGRGPRGRFGDFRRAVQRAAAARALEPISIIGTCATEAMWDAGRGGEPEAICRYCEGSRQRDAPRAPRPLRGCGQGTRTAEQCLRVHA